MQSTANPELNDATLSKRSRNSKSGKHAPVGKAAKTNVVPVQNKASKAPVSIAKSHRTTKQELVLSMLSQKGGTTIAEIMAKTSWQTHTVRGFFAGTIKKKLGFTLSSSKAKGDGRRYRIETRRSR